MIYNPADNGMKEIFSKLKEYSLKKTYLEMVVIYLNLKLSHVQ